MLGEKMFTTVVQFNEESFRLFKNFGKRIEGKLFEKRALNLKNISTFMPYDNFELIRELNYYRMNEEIEFTDFTEKDFIIVHTTKGTRIVLFCSFENFCSLLKNLNLYADGLSNYTPNKKLLLG